MAQLMPLPLTVSCFSKIQIGFTFLVPAHPGSLGQGAVRRVCVYRYMDGYCRTIIGNLHTGSRKWSKRARAISFRRHRCDKRLHGMSVYTQPAVA